MIAVVLNEGIRLRERRREGERERGREGEKLPSQLSIYKQLPGSHA
jgi:hypothetical protein